MVALALIVLSLSAACGSSPTRPSTPTRAQANPADPSLLVESEPGYGRLVTDPEGSPLYAWTGGGRGGICGPACPKSWIPLDVPNGATANAGVGVRNALIGTVPAPGGDRQITYRDHPVYIYLGDTTTQEVNGNGKKAKGGTFRAIEPSGKLAPRRARHH
jgi:predicted lipoprotein with Yx(FWY)xxD motif